MMADEVILSFRIKSNHGHKVFLNNIQTGNFVVPEQLKNAKELHFSELDRLGDLLGKALFNKNPLLVDSLKAVPLSSRLVLEFREGAEDLLSLPWEYIKNPQSGQTLSLERPFVRRIGTETGLEPINGRPLKVLVVISEPLTLPPFNARRFHDVIQREAQGNADKGLLQLEFLNRPSTPDSLTRRLLQEDFDAIHFIGHGNVGVLAFEDELGADAEVEAKNLYPFLRGKKVRLVILTACYSGAVAAKDLISGTATALVKAGIPSVFAMQLPVEIEAAYHLVGDLYATLFSQPFDELIRILRASRFFAERLHAPAQWGVPVFYLQDKSRDLFQGVSQGQSFLKAWSSSSPSHFLPERPELFVGRKELLKEVNGALKENRVIVLQGESGMGKSFLALELSHWHKDRGNFQGGIIWIDLQAGGSYDTVLERIGQALFGKTTSEEGLKNRLAEKPTLIILDSFETVKEDTKLAKFISSLPKDTRALLTSIEHVGIGYILPVWEMKKEEATEFFWHRARKAGWDGIGYEHIPELCDALGCMPLNIELVASQAASLSLPTIVEMIKKSLDAIAAKRPELPQRHQKAEAALRASYDHLEPEEKVLFARMSVFPGDASHEIISRVAEIPDVVVILSRLHKKGLVRFGNDRYWLHSIVRRFALERLEKDFQNRDKYEIKFAEFFAGLAFWCQKILETEKSRIAVTITQLELQNFLAAQEWFFKTGKWSECLYFADALHLLLGRAGLWRARVSSSSLALEAAQKKGDEQNIAISLHQLGIAYYDLGDLSEAEKHYKEILRISEEIKDEVETGAVLHELGMIELTRGNVEKAGKYFKKSLKIKKKIGTRTKTDIANIAATLFQLGIIEFERSNLTKSERYHRESLKIYEEIGNKAGIAKVLHELAFVEFEHGNLDEAKRYSKRGLKLKEEIGDKPGIARSFQQLGTIEGKGGNPNIAEEYCKKALEIFEEIGDKLGFAKSLFTLGVVMAKRGKSEEALKLFLIAVFGFHEIGAGEEKNALHAIATIRMKLGEEKFQEILNKVKEEGYPFS